MFGKTVSRTGGYRLLLAALFVISLLAGRAGSVAASSGGSGAIYTMTNASDGNAIQVYERASDGKLTKGDEFSTGGKGSGSGLGSQGAIVLSPDHNWLFAVNAGSDDISVFSVHSHELDLADRVSSHGSMPISLTYNNSLLYVLNAGGSGNIAGFNVSSDGHLSYIHGSTRPLSSDSSSLSPEEIGFTPDGSHLIVSEKGSNKIDTYTVSNRAAHGPVVSDSAGPAPYGFGFANNHVLVISEAANSAVSTYKVSSKLKSISESVADTQKAACWLVVTDNGSYAYAANAGSGTISGYRVSDKGKLSLLRSDGVNGDTGSGSHPIDMSFSSHDRYLYVLASGNNTINAFSVNGDGSLTFIDSFDSPAGASGLAAQ